MHHRLKVKGLNVDNFAKNKEGDNNRRRVETHPHRPLDVTKQSYKEEEQKRINSLMADIYGSKNVFVCKSGDKILVCEEGEGKNGLEVVGERKAGSFGKFKGEKVKLGKVEAFLKEKKREIIADIEPNWRDLSGCGELKEICCCEVVVPEADGKGKSKVYIAENPMKLAQKLCSEEQGLGSKSEISLQAWLKGADGEFQVNEGVKIRRISLDEVAEKIKEEVEALKGHIQGVAKSIYGEQAEIRRNTENKKFEIFDGKQPISTEKFGLRELSKLANEQREEYDKCIIHLKESAKGTDNNSVFEGIIEGIDSEKNGLKDKCKKLEDLCKSIRISEFERKKDPKFAFEGEELYPYRVTIKDSSGIEQSKVVHYCKSRETAADELGENLNAAGESDKTAIKNLKEGEHVTVGNLLVEYIGLDQRLKELEIEAIKEKVGKLGRRSDINDDALSDLNNISLWKYKHGSKVYIATSDDLLNQRLSSEGVPSEAGQARVFEKLEGLKGLDSAIEDLEGEIQTLNKHKQDAAKAIFGSEKGKDAFILRISGESINRQNQQKKVYVW